MLIELFFFVYAEFTWKDLNLNFLRGKQHVGESFGADSTPISNPDKQIFDGKLEINSNKINLALCTR